MPAEPVERLYSVPLECRYLLEPPSGEAPLPLVAVAMHGYGQNPRDMLRLTRSMIGPGHWIASLRAPHPFTLKPFTPNSEVGYNWGTPGENWPAAIRLHHAIVLEALRDLATVTPATPERTLLIGFSQPVGLNYRFARAHPGAIRGVIGVCGGVPTEWEQLPLPPASAAILHLSRSEDEYYSLERVEKFAGRLSAHSTAPVEFHLLPGPHRFPSQAGEIVRNWIGKHFT